MQPFQFLPSAEAAAQTNLAMHDRLFKSLNYLVEVLSGADAGLQNAYQAWRSRLPVGSNLPPSVFGTYYEAVEALQADDTHTGLSLLADIFQQAAAPQGVKLRILGPDYSEREMAIIQKFMGAPETGVAGVTAPDPRKAERFIVKLREAINWIDANVPELSGEMNTLLRDLVLVGPAKGQATFEGGTCFRLWGAVALNAERRASFADLIVTLAHEEGHAALFGACQEEMLVENPDSERYWSPIRGTERPLEGIFHASFVSARMVWVLGRMQESKDFSWLERRRLESTLRETEAIQRESADIVRREGRLTRTGQDVLAAMTGFMSGQAATLQSA